MQTYKREVPYEVMFKLSDATQDPIKKNRYWFDFPSQWANQLDKDPIIGIRDMYLTKSDRVIAFYFTIELRDSEDNMLWIKRKRLISLRMKADDNIYALVTAFNDQYKSIFGDETTEDQDISNKRLTFASTNYQWTNIFLCDYLHFPDRSTSIFSIGIKQSVSEINLKVTDTLGQQHDAYFYLSITPFETNAAAIFGSEESIGSEITTDNPALNIPIWSRENCYILSSLAEDDVNNFLGHTKASSYHPFKYYRLKNRSKKFWIELYESKSHTSRVIFPVNKIPNPNYNSNQPESDTNKKYNSIYMIDDLFIEAIVCFNSTGML